MRNALLPSVPSHLYNFGNNIDVQMSNWDAQMNMNTKIGFCMGSKASESDSHNNRRGDYSLPMQSPSLIAYQPVNNSSGAFRYDGVYQQSMLLDETISAPQFEDFQAIQNARKRPMEVDELGGLVGDRTALNEWNKNKRNKVTNSQQQWHHHQLQVTSMEQQNNKLRVPAVRRSQKLSDKITALQKLVSPYGKTDTASVLQEASIYITLLHEQIQNLLRMLGSSYNNAAAIHTQECGSREVLDLRSKGLCLVPLSVTQKVTMEEGVDHVVTSRKIVIANNF